MGIICFILIKNSIPLLLLKRDCSQREESKIKIFLENLNCLTGSQQVAEHCTSYKVQINLM